MKAKKRVKGLMWAALGGIAAAGVRAYQDSKTFGITQSVVELPTLPSELDGYKIAHLSDLHGKVYDGDNFALMQTVNYFSPDLVVMTGDMVSRGEKEGFGSLLALAEHFAARYPTFFVPGNHEMDYSPAVLEQLWSDLRARHVRVLLNETERIAWKGTEIAVSGLCLPMKYYQKDCPLSVAALHKLLGNPDPDRFRILLAHNPIHFRAYAAWGADLTLSGHIHGGGIRLPLIGGVLSPDRTFFPEYSAGVYQEGDRRIVVSRGLGGKAVDIRINNQAELLWVTLRRQPKNGVGLKK